MAVTKVTYGTKTALTVSSLNGLASGSSATSAVIDNTTTLALDYEIQAQLITASGTLATPAYVPVTAIGSLDNTTFDDSGNAAFAASVTITTAAVQANKTFSLAELFGGQLPPYVELIFTNNTGVALGSTGNAVNYTAITLTTA